GPHPGRHLRLAPRPGSGGCLMRRLGVYLIYAAVALRGLVRLGDGPWLGLAGPLLALYGLMLVLAEKRLLQSDPVRFSLARGGDPPRGPFGVSLAYFVVQSALVVGMLFIPPILDFFGLLFVPLSVQAVFFFGRRWGLLCIG